MTTGQHARTHRPDGGLAPKHSYFVGVRRREEPTQVKRAHHMRDCNRKKISTIFIHSNKKHKEAMNLRTFPLFRFLRPMESKEESELDGALVIDDDGGAEATTTGDPTTSPKNTAAADDSTTDAMLNGLRAEDIVEGMRAVGIMPTLSADVQPNAVESSQPIITKPKQQQEPLINGCQMIEDLIRRGLGTSSSSKKALSSAPPGKVAIKPRVKESNTNRIKGLTVRRLPTSGGKIITVHRPLPTSATVIGAQKKRIRVTPATLIPRRELTPAQLHKLRAKRLHHADGAAASSSATTTKDASPSEESLKCDENVVDESRLPPIGEEKV